MIGMKGESFGFGSVTPRPTNSGLIRSHGGTLTFADGIQGGSGTVRTDVGRTFSVSGGPPGRRQMPAQPVAELGRLADLPAHEICTHPDLQQAAIVHAQCPRSVHGRSAQGFLRRQLEMGAGQLHRLSQR